MSVVAVVAVIGAAAAVLVVQSGALSWAGRWWFDGLGETSVSVAAPAQDGSVSSVATLPSPAADQTEAVQITPSALPTSGASLSAARSAASSPAKAAAATTTRTTTTAPKPKPLPRRSPTPTPKPKATTTTVSGAAAEVVRLTNQERQANGCPALKVNAALTRSASGHSADMAAKGYFDHDSPDGRTPFDRMKDAGYSFSMAAENIAAGQPTPSSVVSGWMNSEGHRKNILNCALTEIGVGVAKGGDYGIYWTQNFGTPR